MEVHQQHGNRARRVKVCRPAETRQNVLQNVIGITSLHRWMVLN